MRRTPGAIGSWVFQMVVLGFAAGIVWNLPKIISLVFH